MAVPEGGDQAEIPVPPGPPAVEGDDQPSGVFASDQVAHQLQSVEGTDGDGFGGHLGKGLGGGIPAGAEVLVLFAAGFFTLRSLPDDSHHPFYQSKLTSRFCTWHHRVADDDMDTSVPADSFIITDGNRQKVHARIAVANGSIKGVLPGNSVQRDFLAQPFSDFIYAIIAEELGIGGCAFVLLLYIILYIRAGRIASRCENNFPAFLILGLATLLVVQALLNMMVAVGLFPVTGQTLPMVSRGGTSTLITAMYFGMMLSVSRYARSNGKKSIPNVAREESAEIQKDFQQG